MAPSLCIGIRYRSMPLHLLPAPLVDRDVGLRGRAGDELADGVERQVVELLEADARLPHVELLAGLLERLPQPALLPRVAVGAHQVESVVVLLRGERGVAQGLAVVGIWIALEGDLVVDGPPIHPLPVARGEMVED